MPLQKITRNPFSSLLSRIEFPHMMKTNDLGLHGFRFSMHELYEFFTN
jgi:hypothetical protein